jgi:plastocyanin
MHSISAWCGAPRWVTLVLFLILGASGCAKQSKVGNVPACGDKTVKIDPSYGADPDAVYVCEGDTVTWNPTANVGTFVVEFKNDYPFDGLKKKFDKGESKSPKTKPQPNLKVYEYKLMVDGKSFGDPQVVGGGGGH